MVSVIAAFYYIKPDVLHARIDTYISTYTVDNSRLRDKQMLIHFLKVHVHIYTVYTYIYVWGLKAASTTVEMFTYYCMHTIKSAGLQILVLECTVHYIYCIL